VVAAIRLVLEKLEKVKALSFSSTTSTHSSRYYYYTRPIKFRDPIPYGRYLSDYRAAHDIKLAVWIPPWTVKWFVAAVHWCALTPLAKHLPYLESVDYLLQVSAREHSFDCSRFAADFTEIISHEETFEACFRRRRRQLLQSSSLAVVLVSDSLSKKLA
jgi:hypothetical protein